MHNRCCWPPERLVPGDVEDVLDLLPKACMPKRVDDPLVQLVVLADAEKAEPGGDVLVDRHVGERTRLLEDRPDPEPHAHDVLRPEVLTVQEDRARDPRAWELLVETVQAP